MLLVYTLLLVPFFHSQTVHCGNRPTQLINIETECENAPEVKGSVLTQLGTEAKGFFGTVKGKLGIKNEPEPKKPEYYKCVFERLGMFNQLDLPDLVLIQSWISKNVDGGNKIQLNNQAGTCFQELRTSFVNADKNYDTTTHLMKCLHAGDQCEVFKYP